MSFNQALLPVALLLILIGLIENRRRAAIAKLRETIGSLAEPVHRCDCRLHECGTEKDEKACIPPPHMPPITATWPSRWVKVNGFRYVLDEKEQSR